MSLLKRIVAVEESEVRPMLWAALYYFLVLAAYFVIRPIRDEMGIAGGVRNLPWLFLGTLLGMFLIHPLFTAARLTAAATALHPPLLHLLRRQSHRVLAASS